MIANYHTHTPRCNHASGSAEDYVTTAIGQGLKILGFSDHAPYVFPEGYYSNFRMKMDQLDSYIDEVLAVREKYADVLQIPLGLEMEYYPATFSETVAILRDKPMDYLILGQHFLGNEMGEHYNGAPTEDASLLVRYCDQVIEAMHTGLYTYFAHPDLCNFRGEREVYRAQMRRVCAAANECGMPVEINLLGLADGRHYPNRLFWEVAAEESCQVVLGRDAHQPEALKDTATEEKARKMAAELGLRLVDTVALRPIR